MSASPESPGKTLAPDHGALQHGPRPLPLFLAILAERLGHDPAAMEAVLAGLRRYQREPRPVNAAPRATLLQRGKVRVCAPRHGASRVTRAEQIDTLFIPSPINAPDILDLDAERSLLGFLGDAGMHPALLDWGRTDAGNAGETLDSYVTDHLLPLLGALSRPVHLVGYCLGGTIAMAAVCLHPVRSLTLIAAPWDFAGYPPERRDDLAALWQRNQRLCRAMGVVPMELIQSTFWTLSGEQLVAKYRRFGAMPKGSAEARRFVAIEDWANGGEPLPYGFGRQLFEDMFTANRTASGTWRVNGQLIAPTAIRAPAFELASDRDAIVPLACSPRLPNRSILGAGHVGMVIGGSAPERLWQELKDWLLSVGAG